jgi:hypothetical protein
VGQFSRVTLVSTLRPPLHCQVRCPKCLLLQEPGPQTQSSEQPATGTTCWCESGRRLGCDSCSTVLSYSYRDPAKKKNSFSTDGSEVVHGGRAGYAQPSSYSTTEEERVPRPPRNRSLSRDGGIESLSRMAAESKPSVETVAAASWVRTASIQEKGEPVNSHGQLADGHEMIIRPGCDRQ